MKSAIPVIQAVSVAIVLHGRVLLVERGHAPSKGKFAFPGGRVETGESLEAAARRELYEETNLSASAFVPLTRALLPGTDRRYDLTVFLASDPSGELKAGDDAVSAGFYSRLEMDALPMSLSTLEAVDNFLMPLA